MMDKQTQDKAVKVDPTFLDDNLDDFDFKPLTEGLGFHHERADKVITTVTKLSAHDKTIHSRPVVSVADHVQQQVRDQFMKNDLALFYGQNQTTLQPLMGEQAHLELEKPVEVASMGVRAVAYFVDITLLVMLMAVASMTVEVLTDVSLWEMMVNGQTDAVLAALVFFTGCYMSYFSVLEKVQGYTFGKELVSLKVVSNDNKTLLTLYKTYARSFISLMTFMTVGFAAMMDLQNKLTDTKVIRTK